MSIKALAKLTGASEAEVAEALQALTEEYATRGIVVREIAGGYRFASAPAARATVEAYLLPAKTNLSAAGDRDARDHGLLQPATKGEIEAVRGVNVDSVVSTLLDRRFILEAGRRETVGRPVEYQTTPEFLEAFGLRSLNELPPVDLDPVTTDLPLSDTGRTQRRPTVIVNPTDKRFSGIWAQIEENSQTIAEARDLVQPGERFALTDDQRAPSATSRRPSNAANSNFS